MFDASIVVLLYNLFSMAIDWTPLFKKYKGKWVALKKDETTVIGSGETLKEALSEARANGYEKPILTRMPTQLIPYIGNGLSL